jgi:hypothetical protein
MDATHAHLFLNHLPLIGAIICLCFIAYFMMKNNLQMTMLFLSCFVVIAVIAIPVFLTGDPAGETVKKIAGIEESVIENHEEAAWLSLVAIELTGALALLGIVLFRKREKLSSWFKYCFIILTLVSIVSLARTANLGGEIRHTEIRTLL